MIYAELKEPHIAVVTRGCDVKGVDQNTQQEQSQVRPVSQKKTLLDVQKEKEFFLDVRPQFVDVNQPSESGKLNTMSERFEQLLKKQPMKKVSKLKKKIQKLFSTNEW